jgi:hypothetical protein
MAQGNHTQTQRIQLSLAVFHSFISLRTDTALNGKYSLVGRQYGEQCVLVLKNELSRE